MIHALTIALIVAWIIGAAWWARRHPESRDRKLDEYTNRSTYWRRKR